MQAMIFNKSQFFNKTFDLYIGGNIIKNAGLKPAGIL